MFEIIIIILTFSILIILHELGHFLVAKKFGVKVEEFGLGLPPKLFSKKIGETIFSLNLIPFGGFVRMFGEEENIKDPRSFTSKSIWQRALIVFAGVAAFWILAIILFSVIFGLGTRIIVGDDEYGERIINPIVQIPLKNPLIPAFLPVVPDSPAYTVGLKPGDIIKQLRINNYALEIDKIRQVQEFTEKHRGKEIILTIQRDKEIFDVSLIPRIEPPEDEGAMGVALTRTAIKSFPWYEAPIKGMEATANFTYMIIIVFAQIIENSITREPLPEGVELMGPIGIFDFMGDRLQIGIVYFLKFIAILVIHLAIFNLLPIPALDGGKLLFLGIEAIRKKPIPQEIEQKITAFFFVLLITLLIFVTIEDIDRIF
jgi:regulator of sigma E protease